MEKAIKISLGDKKYIYGTLRGELNKALVIFVHGFTGHQNEHIFFNGASFFEKNGLSSFRFNLYDWVKNARKLEDCTLTLHGKDLDRVIKYFRRKGVKKIFVIGHSFGGLAILLSKDKNFDKIVLWDTSVKPVITAKYIKELDKYYVDDATFGFTIGQKMYEENKKLTPFKLIKGINIPIKIVVAGAGKLVKGGNKYYQLANEPKAFSSIAGASHCFDEQGTEEKLFEETLAWIKQGWGN